MVIPLCILITGASTKLVLPSGVQPAAGVSVRVSSSKAVALAGLILIAAGICAIAMVLQKLSSIKTKKCRTCVMINKNF
jgi:hypothetical protein